VLLLMIHAGSQSLVLATDGGATLGTPLTLPAAFNSFAALSSGTLLVGGLLASGGAVLLRSQDRGQSFQQVADPPEIVGMAARSGRLYAALTYAPTLPALAASDDEGTTWTNLMAYSDVQAILPCVKATCRTTCETQAMLGLWPEQTCLADPASSPNGGPGGAARGDASAAEAVTKVLAGQSTAARSPATERTRRPPGARFCPWSGFGSPAAAAAGAEVSPWVRTPRCAGCRVCCCRS